LAKGEWLDVENKRNRLSPCLIGFDAVANQLRLRLGKID